MASHITNGVTNGVVNGHMNGHCNGYANNNVKKPLINGAATKSEEVVRTDEKAQDFLHDLSKLMIDEVLPSYDDRDSKVIEFHQPQELEKLMDFTIGKHGMSNEKLMALSKQVVKYSVKTGHARFFNQLFAGVDPYSLGGSWLADCLNANAYTYEIAPVFVTMEKALIDKLMGYIGYKNGEGLFCPGGSMCNFFAVNVARYQAENKIKTEGHATLQRMVMYTSEDSHYSLQKAASFMGIGLNNLKKVKCDKRGRMDPADLEAQIIQTKEEGAKPFFVNATSGTTVIGAYDPLPEISAVCKRHGVWMHVDATWGGGCMFSPKHKHLVEGIDQADSVSWNLHKMMGVLLQCSALMVKHPGLLHRANSASADYLFQPDKYYDPSYDMGDKSLQCGRKIDSLKAWYMWKAHGDEGIARRIDTAFDNARYLEKRLRETEGFRMLLDVDHQCTQVCFFYIPTRLRGLPETPEWWEELGKVAPAIKKIMVCERGDLIVGHQPMKRMNLPNFWRFVVMSPHANHDDMDFVIEQISSIGERV